MCSQIRIHINWAIATECAVIKNGDKLFCTKYEMVLSLSDVEQWTYKCFVIFYRLLRHADVRFVFARYESVSLCMCANTAKRRRVCGMRVFTMQRIQLTRTIKLVGATQLTRKSRHPASPRVPTPPTYRVYNETVYMHYTCGMALWLCTKRQIPIDASDK